MQLSQEQSCEILLYIDLYKAPSYIIFDINERAILLYFFIHVLSLKRLKKEECYDSRDVASIKFKLRSCGTG